METHDDVEWWEDHDGASGDRGRRGAEGDKEIVRVLQVQERQAPELDGVEGNICSKQVATSPHKMMHGHYLQKRGELSDFGEDDVNLGGISKGYYWNWSWRQQ